uniref:Uncharacterized protein n=1 Tax=Anguilla anguilla TaxID=7936 RepID=A0A0E9XJ64_ANGAN
MHNVAKQAKRQVFCKFMWVELAKIKCPSVNSEYNCCAQWSVSHSMFHLGSNSCQKFQP